MAGALVSSFTGVQLGCNCRTAQLRPLASRPSPARFSPAVAPIEAAHKKGAGSTKNGRDSNSKRRGVKVYGGQAVGAGGIIVRQLGTHVRLLASQNVAWCCSRDCHNFGCGGDSIRMPTTESIQHDRNAAPLPQFHPGPGVGLGKDYTLYATRPGVVHFHMTKYKSDVS